MSIERERQIEISPSHDRLRKLVACQCDLGQEKPLTAPILYSWKASDDPRHKTAPLAREVEPYKCPDKQVLVTFRSPHDPNDTYHKVFPSTTPIKYVKRKLANLLSVSDSNLLLTKNRNVLKESSLLSSFKPNVSGNIVIDVFTKDSEEFSLSSIPKEFIQESVTPQQTEKRSRPFISVKFRIRNQNETFTRSYHSILKIHEIKKNLAGLFNVDPDNMVIFRGENPLQDRMALNDLDYDKYGNVEVELFMKESEKLKVEKLYKENVVNDVITVAVEFGDTYKLINVEIFNDPMKKPYLGGYRNVHTGTQYHHAYTQTPQKPEKLPPEKKTCRDTQTAEEKEKVYDTAYSRSTQMNSCNIGVYIPSVSDRIVEPKPYETYDEMVLRLNLAHHAAVIQRAFRHHQFRQKVDRWIKICLERIARMKEEDRLDREAEEKRRRMDLITKTFPKTREDFDQLYAMVDRWKHAEMARISQLHAKGPKIAEFTLLLDKEVELLRCIEEYRVKVKADSIKLKEKKFLEEISKPVTWFGRDGKIVQMDTVETQRARKLKELYNAFTREGLEVKERMELLVNLKFGLQEFRHPLAEEIVRLLDREADLMVRRCNDRQLEFLRKRIAKSVFQLIKTSELNSKVTKLKDIREHRTMEDGRMYLCEMCHQVKHHKEFPLNTRTNGFFCCLSCTWKDVNELLWIDMTPYKFILRAVQRDERKRKCWGSLAFVLQEKDVFFIVEKLWHRHSVISESTDIIDLRLCRWDVNKDWAPWNCFLVTVSEMKAHLKLENPEEVYDEDLVKKVKNKLSLAKANFEQLISVNKRFTESHSWHEVRAGPVDIAGGVNRI